MFFYRMVWGLQGLRTLPLAGIYRGTTVFTAVSYSLSKDKQEVYTMSKCIDNYISL